MILKFILKKKNLKSIRKGFPRFKKRNTILNIQDDNYKFFRKYGFKIYRGIPFLFEIKTSLDWTFSTTSLDLFQWIRFEDIYANLYMAKCDSEDFKKKKLGTKIGIFKKIIFGFCIWIVILLLIMGPMILFSSLNPITEKNLVTGSSIELGLKINNTNYFKIFENSHFQDIHLVDENKFTEFKFNTSRYYRDIDRDTFQVRKL